MMFLGVYILPSFAAVTGDIDWTKSGISPKVAMIRLRNRLSDMDDN